MPDPTLIDAYNPDAHTTSKLIRAAVADLCAAGLAVCKPGQREKKPTYRGWSARSLEAKDFGPAGQVGIMGGPLSDFGRPGHALVILDLDAADAIEKADQYLPDTSMVEGRLGKPRSHRYYLVPCDTIPKWAISQAAQAAPAAIEATGHAGAFTKSFQSTDDKEAFRFIGTGGQVVVPPSMHDSGERREWHVGRRGEPAIVPFGELWDAACDLAAAVGARIPDAERISLPASPRSLTPIIGAKAELDAIKYLNRIDPAIAGQGGHGQTFWAARAVVYGFDLGPQIGYQLLRDYYNSRCEPHWTDAELWHKANEADTRPFAKPRGWLLDELRAAIPREPRLLINGRLIEYFTDIEAAEPDDESEADDTSALPIVTIGQLVLAHPTMRPPVIEGLLRVGETANLISASKVGKSWLTYAVAIAKATGRRVLDTFRTDPGKVLLIDNELHRETIASRLPKVAAAMHIEWADVAARISVLPLRGKLQNIHSMRPGLLALKRGRFDLIIVDAFYRALPPGTNENSNPEVAALYNLIDEVADTLGAAFMFVHHSSKGEQADKAVTDVGAGAGSQSRATDSHIILRPHEEKGAFVLEAAVRSFEPVEQLCLRWKYPTWTLALTWTRRNYAGQGGRVGRRTTRSNSGNWKPKTKQ